MTPIIEDAVLGSELDCNGFQIKNPGALLPVPPGLVSMTDPRLSDGRSVLAGSVTNNSVAPTAAIAQDKLNFNGSMPAGWIGTGEKQAAPGNLTEMIANKDVANGYASLTSEGILTGAVASPGPEVGTVNSVSLRMPPEFQVTTGPIEDAGPLIAIWREAPAYSYLGRNQPITTELETTPSFLTTKVPIELIPDLDTAKFVSGFFDVALLPFAVGLGAGHAPGILPDPGFSGDGNDYIGRDMKWHVFSGDISYQPVVPNVQIAINYMDAQGRFSVTIRSILKKSVLFYRVNGGNFTEVQIGGLSDNHITLMVEQDDFVEAYASKAGYNNSPISSLLIQPPSTFF